MDIREASDPDLIEELEKRGINTIRTFKTRDLRAEIERREEESLHAAAYTRMMAQGLV